MKHKFSINRLTLTFASLLLVSSCTNKNGAEKALKDAGYHPIEVGGYGLIVVKMICMQQDLKHTRQIQAEL